MNHSRLLSTLFSSLALGLLPAAPAAGATTADTLSYAIVTDSHRQLHEGWGVSLCWWAGQCGKWQEASIDKLVDWMVSPTGLNWNVFRYNIGGGDDPQWTNCTEHHMGKGKGLRAEMEGFQDERGGAFHWERDAAQRKIMLKIKEKRPDAVFEAFSNSAPWWMTVSGCCAGNAQGGKDNLRKDYYEDFADYLVEVCKHYKEEYGIEFRTLEPFNEAMTGYWSQSGGQEGCHFDVDSEIAFLKVLAPKLRASGLNTMISASDETSVMDALTSMRGMMKDGIADEVGQFNTHTYSASHTARSQYGSLARAAGKVVWMSETGSGGSGINGNLKMAQRLFDDIRYICPSAWVDWQYVEEGNDQWCLVKGNFSAGSYSKVKNFYVRQQVTRFIPVGYTFVTSLNEQSLAALNPTGDTLAVVLLNTEKEVFHHISLPMARVNGDITGYRTTEAESMRKYSSKTVGTFLKDLTDSTFTVRLPANSITTLQVPVRSWVKYSAEPVDGDKYLIIPQSNTLQAVAASDTELKLSDIDINDPAQQWQLLKQADGTWKLRNGKGQYVKGSTSYALSTSTTGTASGLDFDIEKVDGIYSRILWHTDGRRAWDLEGKNLTKGTRLGLWDYGTSADADHRQFLLVRIASQQTDEATSIKPLPQEARSTRHASCDLLGRPVSSTAAAHGIYVVNDRKVVRQD